VYEKKGAKLCREKDEMVDERKKNKNLMILKKYLCFVAAWKIK
jgi:hypothetical protein